MPTMTPAQVFVGETNCGTAPCHGAKVDTAEPPWKWARSQWINSNIDRHSRAYATLRTGESKRIAGYMGIGDATSSEKCTVCHAPDAQTGSFVVEGQSKKSLHKRSDGVSCEHCHGPAQHWLPVHSVKEEWKTKRKEFAKRGFYDNNDFVKRAEKCAECHVAIDHEIVAGGHPPLQFEMVAYAQVMMHWDDREENPSVDVDPTIWAIGQIEGLRRALRMVAERAGSTNYQSIGKFPHFKERECFQCHHKLVEDGLRQARGHYEMARIYLEAKRASSRGELDQRWASVVKAGDGNAQATQSAAQDFADWLQGIKAQAQASPLSKAQARAILTRLTAAADRVSGNPLFGTSRSKRSNVVEIREIGLPWWYTTGAPEQTILALLALCPSAYDPGTCDKLTPDIERLNSAANREELKPDAFAGALRSIGGKLR